jgi:hypothetical protein
MDQAEIQRRITERQRTAVAEQREIGERVVAAGDRARKVLRNDDVREYFALGYARALAYLRGCDLSLDMQTVTKVIMALQVQASMEQYLFGSITAAQDVAKQLQHADLAGLLDDADPMVDFGGDGPPANMSDIASQTTDTALSTTPDREALEEYEAIQAEFSQ